MHLQKPKKGEAKCKPFFFLTNLIMRRNETSYLNLSFYFHFILYLVLYKNVLLQIVYFKGLGVTEDLSPYGAPHVSEGD